MPGQRIKHFQYKVPATQTQRCYPYIVGDTEGLILFNKQYERE